VSLQSFVQEKILLPRKWKQYRNNRPQPKFISLNKAGKIGIIADFRETSLVRIVSDFHRKLKKEGISISLAAILQDERNNFNQFEYERQFPGSLVYLIASDEINRWGQANRKVIQPFIEQKFDIIFYLDRTPTFTLMDLLLSTSSKMVAGRISEGRDMIDFGIELDPSTPLEDLTANLYKYLVSIGAPKIKEEAVDPDLKLF
jgi:hypothetical protein